ncbi:MAG: hypothetical protein AAF721_05530 [Myxococcota bacterium]
MIAKFSFAKNASAPLIFALCGALAAGCTGDTDDGDDDGADTGGSDDNPTTTNMPTTNTPDTGTADGMDDPDTDTGGSDDMMGTTVSVDDTAGSSTGTPTACEVTPKAWDAPDWEANTVEALAVRAQLDAIAGGSGIMRLAEQGGDEVQELADLTAAWEAGDPSLADVVNPGYSPIVDGAFDEFLDVLAAGPLSLIDSDNMWLPGAEGGIWGMSDRAINEGGLELRQLIDKGGFGPGAMYAYALGLTEGDLEPATFDAIAAAWGNNATLDPDDKKNGLTDAAGYSHSMGFHADMVTALTDAKAYSADAECDAERDAAVQTFFQLWEQTLMARAVFYGNRAEGKLLAAASDSDFADVLHDLAEGIGVAAGFTGLPDPAAGPLMGAGRTITDADLDMIIASFGVDPADLGNSTTGLFVESLPNLEIAVGEVEGVVMDVYEVDEATIMGYADPTPG